jgi:hypothetical protein
MESALFCLLTGIAEWGNMFDLPKKKCVYYNKLYIYIVPLKLQYANNHRFLRQNLIFVYKKIKGCFKTALGNRSSTNSADKTLRQ